MKSTASTLSLSQLEAEQTRRAAARRVQQLRRAVDSRRLVGDHDGAAILSAWLAEERGA